MANPLVIEVVADTVTKIATNVKTGFVRNLSRFTPLLCTFRATGTAAPSAAVIQEEGYPLFAADNVSEQITNSAEIDVYVYSPNVDTKIRVDLP